MNIFQAMKKRRSVRRFTFDPVPRRKLEKLVATAMLAPSGCNDQGWVFVVVDGPEIKKRIAEVCRWGKFIEEAAACIAIFCDKESTCIVEDCSAATENLMLAAVAEGLGTCWVNSHGLEHAAGVERILNCPESHELVVLVAVGVPEGETPAPNKKPLDEVIRWNGF